MKVNGIILNEKDNVVTTIEEIPKGDTVKYFLRDEIEEVTAIEHIPIYNKISIRDLNKGEKIIKYGEIIGEAIEAIEVGKYVSHLNIDSLPRDYDNE